MGKHGSEARLWLVGVLRASVGDGLHRDSRHFGDARHGRELIGFNSLVCEPLYALSVGKILDEGNCGRAPVAGAELPRK